MITVPHEWVQTNPPVRFVTKCRNCGVKCDTTAGAIGGLFTSGGPFFSADGEPLGAILPPCLLVPPSEHIRGPWEVSNVNHDEFGYYSRYSPPVVVYAMQDCDIHPIADCSCNHTCRDEGLQVANAALIARAPAMRDALEATLLFYRAAYWDDECRARWLELTGTTEATSRTLCDCIRKALK